MDDPNNITAIITTTINTLIQNLLGSLDNSLYQILDNITFINSDIVNSSLFQRLLGTNNYNGLLLITNSLLIGLSIYYGFRLLYSRYMNIQIEKPYQFILKLIIIGICMNSSFFLCTQFIQINSLITDAILSVGKNILHCEISFSELINKLNSTISIGESDFTIFSFDGIIKCFTSFTLFNLVFSYALRYIMIKVFILLTPFFILALINNSTSWLFKSWFRSFFSLLIQQSFIAIILLVIFSFNITSNTIFSKLMCIGGIYALTRANSYIRAIIGGISTDVSNNLNLGSNLIKK